MVCIGTMISANVCPIVNRRASATTVATVDGSAFPAILDPLVWAETQLDTPPPGGNDEFYPSVAWNGTEYFVAWEDDTGVSPAELPMPADLPAAERRG